MKPFFGIMILAVGILYTMEFFRFFAGKTVDELTLGMALLSAAIGFVIIGFEIVGGAINELFRNE